MKYAQELIALDTKSVRRYDDNGFLHISFSPLTRVQVAPYRGSEIPGWQMLKLKPDAIYNGYRPADELSKPETVKSINGIPIHLNHHPDYADSPARETRVGATGDDGAFDGTYLTNSLHIYDQKAIDHINDNSMRELSLAYRYTPDFKSGTTPDGANYDFVMRDISANHLALVEEGRAGHNVLVMDHSLRETDRMRRKKPLAQDTGAEAEKRDELLGVIKDAAEKLGALPTGEPPAPDPEKKPELPPKGEDEGEEGAEPQQEEKPAADPIAAVTQALIKKGFSEEEAASVIEQIKAVVKGADDEDDEADDEDDGGDVPDATEEMKPKEDNLGAGDEGEEDAEDDDDEEGEDKPDLIADAMKQCGLDSDDEDARKAFEAGMNSVKKPEAEDEDDDGSMMAEVDDDPAEQEPDEGAGDEDEEELAGDSAAKVKRALIAQVRAAEAVRPVLGKIRWHAYDSAGSIYFDAVKRMGYKSKGLTKHNARAVYEALQYGRSQSERKIAQDAALKKDTSKLASILNNVSREIE